MQSNKEGKFRLINANPGYLQSRQVHETTLKLFEKNKKLTSIMKKLTIVYQLITTLPSMTFKLRAFIFAGLANVGQPFTGQLAMLQYGKGKK